MLTDGEFSRPSTMLLRTDTNTLDSSMRLHSTSASGLILLHTPILSPYSASMFDTVFGRLQ